MKNNKKFYTAYGEGQYNPLFATLNEALEFINPISEKYNEPLIGVSGGCIDDVFNAY
ncbi:hypothetical protein [Lactococcus lactis]|uniref:hypothetical protein n=1 Tax=Lactococcus lactis TaxID=1358 RepID=UPI001F5AAD04|nr:hypothetical protein [Lactococcus lactis]